MVVLPVLGVIALVPAQSSAPAIDPKLVAACGDTPSWFCEGTWNLTHNRLLARGADWVITRPLVGLIIILLGLLLNRWLRRLVTAVIQRVTTHSRAAVNVLGRVGINSADSFMTDPRAAKRADTLSVVARAVVSGLVWSVVTLTVLGVFNINLGPLLAGAGIAGLAVGLGAQSLVRDFVAGFFIILEDQFGVGDEVDLGAAIGTVESLSLRSTLLRSADGTLWTVPNGSILRVGNQSKLWSKALLDITVWYAADVTTVSDLILHVAGEVCIRPELSPLVLDPPEVLGVNGFVPDGYTIRLVVRTKPGAQVGIARELRAALKTAFDEAGIPLHKPTPGA